MEKVIYIAIIEHKVIAQGGSPIELVRQTEYENYSVFVERVKQKAINDSFIVYYPKCEYKPATHVETLLG